MSWPCVGFYFVSQALGLLSILSLTVVETLRLALLTGLCITWQSYNEVFA